MMLAANLMGYRHHENKFLQVCMRVFLERSSLRRKTRSEDRWRYDLESGLQKNKESQLNSSHFLAVDALPVMMCKDQLY